MRVLITGAQGFVGRALQRHSRAVAHELLLPRRADFDLRDPEQARALIKASAPDLVIHAAGVVGGLGANVADPVRFRRENLEIHRNLLFAAFAGRAPRLINLGSSCMYPVGSERPLKESDLGVGNLEPTNAGYVASKLEAWTLARAMRRARPELAWMTLIPPNLYGPGDHYEPDRSHLVAAALAKIRAAKTAGADEVTIWGDGEALRESLFVDDLADFIWRFAERVEILPETLNVGPGEDHTVNAYHEMAAEAVGWTGVFRHDLDKPVGMRRKLLDVSRLSALGWRPDTNMRAGLAKCLAALEEGGA